MQQNVTVYIISCTWAHSREIMTPMLRFSPGIRWLKHIFVTAALHGRMYILTCLFRVFCQYGRSRVVYTVHTLPNLLGLLLWKMSQKLQPSFSWKGRKNTMERTIGFRRTCLLRIRWLKLSRRLPVVSSQQQFGKPKVSKTMLHSLVQHSNQRMQREDSNCSDRSRTEEWRTLEASEMIQRNF